MNLPHDNDYYTQLVDTMFIDFIEGRSVQLNHDELTSDEVTIVHIKFAAKFAEYAGDAINF